MKDSFSGEKTVLGGEGLDDSAGLVSKAALGAVVGPDAIWEFGHGARGVFEKSL